MTEKKVPLKQSEMGKAFEYACLVALYDHHSPNQDVRIVEDDSYKIAKGYFEKARYKQKDFMDGAKAAVRVLNRLEPRLTYPGGASPLFLSLQPDNAGKKGDVRDVLCIRKGNEWEIGLSCKHNHEDLKHSRLSKKLDFGKKWMEIPCSETYFEEIKVVFDELITLREANNNERKSNPVKFEDFTDVEDRFYYPVMKAFIKELKRIDSDNEGIPQKFAHYMMGQNDFYKVITNDRKRLTKIQAINIDGTLSKPSEGHKGTPTIPKIKLPTEFVRIRMVKGSKNTAEIICDNSWTFTLRIHSASKTIESSLKFAVGLKGEPVGFYSEMEPWDKE